jgi:hypothetical protein
MGNVVKIMMLPSSIAKAAGEPLQVQCEPGPPSIAWGDRVVNVPDAACATSNSHPKVTCSAIGRRIGVRVHVASVLSLMMFLATCLVPIGAATAAGPVPRHPAPAGQGPVSSGLPWSSQPYHGLRKGQRTAVEPPHLHVSAQTADGHAGRTPTRRQDSMGVSPHGGPPGGGSGPQATNLSLLPGLAVGDTSLVVYFDAPDAGWTEVTAALYRSADPTTVLHEATLPVDKVQGQQCRTLAIYCWTLGNTDGWELTDGTGYAVTVTLTATDGSQRVSDVSPAATPRPLPGPPPLPADETAGTGAPKDLSVFE